MSARDDMPDWFLKELDDRKTEEDQTYSIAVSDLCGHVENMIDIAREHNCFYCGHFDRLNDTCRIARPPSRPPTFIIVHGCKQFWPEDDIPF